MNKIFLGVISVFVLLFCFEAQAQTFRIHKTIDQDITYAERTLADGRTIYEVVIQHVVVDLTHHPVKSERKIETNETNETLFLTKDAVDELKAALAVAKASTGTDTDGDGVLDGSDTYIQDTVDVEIDNSDKVKDADGNVLTVIRHVVKIDTDGDGSLEDERPQFFDSTAGKVAEDTITTTQQRSAFTTILHSPKGIVSNN